jgi:hypothetical protein
MGLGEVAIASSPISGTPQHATDLRVLTGDRRAPPARVYSWPPAAIRARVSARGHVAHRLRRTVGEARTGRDLQVMTLRDSQVPA